MQNENLENKAGQVKRNPSRDNKNINQGSNNEKQRVDIQTNSNRDAETDKSEFAGDENAMDSGRVSDTSGGNDANRHSGKTQQNAAGKDSGDKQTGSQGLQRSSGAQDANSQGQSEQQLSKKESGESSGSVKYDANEQFDDDEDYGSHQENSTRQ